MSTVAAKAPDAVSADTAGSAVSSQNRPPVLVPFLCPICAAQNAVNLIALSRAGSTNCASCTKKLRSQDVMRAMHAPRKTN